MEVNMTMTTDGTKSEFGHSFHFSVYHDRVTGTTT